MLRKISDALRSLVLKDKVENELNKELRFHLEMETEKNVARGMSPLRGPSSGTATIWRRRKVQR